MYLSGQCEGKAVLYEENKYPYKCIGPVRFLRHPLNVQSEQIWSHPSTFKQIGTQLVQDLESF